MFGGIRVLAPVQTIMEVDGVSLVLLTVEILDDRTAVRFYCPRNSRTRALDDEHAQIMQEFLERHRRGDTQGPPADSPMHTLFAGGFPDSITFDDGCGTVFAFTSGQTGGPDEWLIDAIFRGIPAPEARWAVVKRNR